MRQGGESGLSDAPRMAAVVFCRGETTPDEDQAVRWCQERRLPIFPVVEDLTRFGQLAPASLGVYNISEGEIRIPDDISLDVRPFRVEAPTTIAEAVVRKYGINKMTWQDLANPFRGILR